MSSPQNISLSRLMTTILCLLVFSLQGCAFTVYNWKDIPDESVTKSSEESIKLLHYQKYAIKDISYTMTGNVGFTNYLEPDKVYDLETYAPIIYQSTPESKELFESARMWSDLNFASSQIIMLFSTGYFAALMATVFEDYVFPSLMGEAVTKSQEEFFQGFSQAFIIQGIAMVTYFGLAFYSSQQINESYKKIQTKYNMDLMKELDLESESLQNLLSPQSKIQVKF